MTPVGRLTQDPNRFFGLCAYALNVCPSSSLTRYASQHYRIFQPFVMKQPCGPKGGI